MTTEPPIVQKKLMIPRGTLDVLKREANKRNITTVAYMLNVLYDHAELIKKAPHDSNADKPIPHT